VASAVDAEVEADTTPEDTTAPGHMAEEVDRMTEVATRATEVATAADKAAATTTTTGMKASSPGEEVAEATKAMAETPSRASHPVATKGAHRVVATMIEVAEAEEASTKIEAALEVEITSLQSPAPLSLLFLRIQKMPKLKSAASSPTSSKCKLARMRLRFTSIQLASSMAR